MDKRARWSRILGIIALILIVVGYTLISGGGRRPEYGSLMLIGIILAAAGAFFSRSPSRKLVLWGASVYATTWIPAFSGGVISAIKGGESRGVPPIIITIAVSAGILSLLAIVIGTIGILLEEKRPAPPPTSNGTGEDLAQPTPANAGGLHSAPVIKKPGRKKVMVWGAISTAVPLLVIGIFLLTRGGEKADEPQKVYAEGQYFSVGSTREEVLKIQGPPTHKLEMVWFFEDSQVQFDSDGKVTHIWDVSKNLKVRSEKLP